LTSTGPSPSTEATDTFVPPDVAGAAVLADGVVAAGALVVVLLLDPHALTITATAGIAASRKDLLTSQLSFSLDL
jgi:hypothetical protein